MPPIDDLPGEMILPLRDAEAARYRRDFALQNPDADVGEGSQVWIDSFSHADAMAPLYANAAKIADFVAARNKSGPALIQEAIRLTGSGKLPAAGAIGFVKVVASVGGGTIEVGDAIRNQATGLRYRCIFTSLYHDGDFVPVAGIDTGPATDVPAGTVLQWEAPRPGISPNATVTEAFDGSGLSGGRDEESDVDLDARLVDLRTNPPAAGNDAQIQAAILKTPGMQIAKAFTYPGILGSGSTAFAFTLKSSGLGRIPNPAQIALVRAWIIGQFPADDSILAASISVSPVTAALTAEWRSAGWTDANPWPQFSGSGPTVGTVTSSTVFQVNAPAGDAPQPGQTFAVYDEISRKFYRKQILTATFVSGTTYAIVCDTTNNASDTSFTPATSQLVCPWSDSLPAIVKPLTDYLDGTGPGEMVDPIPDPGLRQRRSPSSSTSSPNKLTRRMLTNVEQVPVVESVDVLLPALDYVTPIGSPGVLVYLLDLADLGAYP